MEHLRGNFMMEGDFLRDCWYVAAWDHELIDGKMLARTLLEKPIILYRGESGQFVAMDDRCCHRAAPLSLGRLEGDCVRCMYHGMKFDSAGQCVEIPGQQKIPPSMKVTSYPVVEKNHLVWIWMGDPALANADDIVDYAPLADSAYRGLPGYMHYDANWMLIVDNLADFAHLAFVHTNTLGGSEEYAYKTKPVSVERLDNGFRVERWHKGAESPPYHKKVISDKDALIDRQNIGTMLLPGMFFLETMFAPAGSGAKMGEEIDVKGVRQYRNCQFMTPESRRSTHFFWNYMHDYDLGDPNITLSLLESIREGFLEDKLIIEMQQKRIELDPGVPLKSIASDAALSHFRLQMKKRLDAERDANALKVA